MKNRRCETKARLRNPVSRIAVRQRNRVSMKNRRCETKARLRNPVSRIAVRSRRYQTLPASVGYVDFS